MVEHPVAVERNKLPPESAPVVMYTKKVPFSAILYFFGKEEKLTIGACETGGEEARHDPKWSDSASRDKGKMCGEVVISS